MNAMLYTLHPLPAALRPAPPSQPARRRRVAGHPLDAARLLRFNRLLAQLHHAPVDGDRIASAARELDRQAGPAREPECIRQRLRLAASIGLMAGDDAWQPLAACLSTMRLVIAYLRDPDGLIPDTLPRVGRLDDAIVVDAALPQLADEVERYLDFCRLREIARAAHGDTSPFVFTRRDWESARRADATWPARRRAFNARSYLPSPAPYFRVH